MAMWLLVGVLVLVELYILGLIRRALARGMVSVNPVSWFGYSEFADVMVERQALPLAYWFVLTMMGAFALVLVLIAYMLVAYGGGMSLGH